MSLPTGQIVRLTQGSARLYGEVIDHITSRDLLWVRPLLLVEPWPESDFDLCLSSQQVQDLREESHLLWPSRLFTVALDTEVLPLLAYLYPDKPKTDPSPEASINLRRFMGQVWQQQWGDRDVAS
jgi:hypothetical protein